MRDMELTLPVLPLRDIVVFPQMIVPLFVGREKSVRALEAVIQESKQILLLAQKSPSVDDPSKEDLYMVGTLGKILQLLKLPDGTIKVLVEGTDRLKVQELNFSDDHVMAHCFRLLADEVPERESSAIRKSLLQQFERYVKLDKKIPSEVMSSLSSVDDLSKFSDTIATHLELSLADKQVLLETVSPVDRLERLYGFIENEIEMLQVQKRIRGRVKGQMEKSQREYYLNEQMKAIQKELGDEEMQSELDDLEKKIADLGMPKEALAKAKSEFKKLKMMAPMSAEATVVRNYIDWLTELPWKKKSRVRRNLKAAEKILNEDHYGLDKIKERILEHLAVLQLAPKIKGPILCLVGPPGVGKTSLAKSIARATNRKYVRISLGGMRDEAEIRGHRRTYIGSMPGKVIQGMKKCGVRNPLILLDEIDKLGADFRGDPASALLEVLDPEQNQAFNDHYLEVDYDLSDVMFITTANRLHIPAPLMDRMELIRLPGYTEIEKMAIAKTYLLPRKIKDHGLKNDQFSVDDASLRAIIRYYTREAGVRNLDREVAKLCRKAVRHIVESGKKGTKVSIKSRQIESYLGVQRYRFGLSEDRNQIGMVTGLAWTEVGGELLQIETIVMPGKGKLMVTGQLGDVMQESVQAAFSYVRSRASLLGLKEDFYHKVDIHVHVPEGAIPKDGPSAGLAMATSIISALTTIPVRRDVCMTGEITLRGKALAIGGLKEKLLAAQRGGLKIALIPKENEKDLKDDIPAEVLKALDIKVVEHLDEVLPIALEHMPDRIQSGQDVLPPVVSEIQAGYTPVKPH